MFEARQIETARGRFGVREAGEGPALVMLHGWPESSYCWKGVAERLAGDFRIVAPDLRGLGDSERTLERDAYAKQALGQDILALLDTLEIERCVLAGHDWGGAVAQEAALAAPERFSGLVLANILVLPNARGNLLAQQALRERGAFYLWYQAFQASPELPEAMIPGNERVWLAYFLRAWGEAEFPEDAFEEYVRCYAKPGTPATGANFYRTYKEDMRRWMQLTGTRFTMPGLYIYGRHDPVIVPEFTRHLEDVFDDVRLEELEAGHFVQEEKPVEFAELVREFAEGKT